MQIAILAPSAVPFTIGGAERLCWALQDHINACTPHQAELIRLPSPESDFWSLVSSYRAFSRLDVTHFDCVISTKYPSWMVAHPQHACYMLHRLRGVYDAYHLFGAPERIDHSEARLRALQALMQDRAGDRGALEEVFARLDELRVAADLPADAFAFPGPLTREIVHFLDGIGLSQRAVSRYAAISRTVAARRDYFPVGTQVEVAYPPPQVTGFRPGPQEYLFTMSRLDAPKRIDLLIEAMRHVRADVPLKIAGTGPDAERLKRLAAGDPRIEFLDYVNDEDAVRWYSSALAVPFVPYDEDLGLITLEAMLSAKPVVTVEDAGGPLEFVEHGVTGLVSAPRPEALAASIDRLSEDREHAARMGKAARERVARIGWPAVVDCLVDSRPAGRTPRRAPRRALTAALSFPVYPPRGGGQTRVFHLYRHLASRFDVRLVTLAEHGMAASDGDIAPGLREIRVPKSAEHAAREAAISAEVEWVPVTDVALPELHEHTPGYSNAIAAAARGARAVIASHPFALPAIGGAAPLWYEAHNVEYTLKRAMLPATAQGVRLLAQTREVEAACCARSELVMTCTAEDAHALRAEYRIATPMHVVPNGVDLESVRFVGPAERRELKRALGLEGVSVVVFMASWHGPNLDAARRALDAAVELPHHLFLFVGSVSQALAAQAVPPNVKLLGVVDDESKALLLGAADIALNPMQCGSGSNLKMLDYMAAGIPVITTPFGARGLLVDDTMVAFAEAHEIAAAIMAAERHPDAAMERAMRARDHVSRHFDWRSIAARFAALVA